MISYVTVTEQDCNNYKNLIPDEKLKLLSASGYYMIGAVDDKGNAKGAICFRLNQMIYDDDPRIIINWLYVGEKDRSKGIGSTLIREVVKVAKEANITLRAEIPYPDIYNDITNFFSENGFDFIYTDSYEFRATLDEITTINIPIEHMHKINIVNLGMVPNGVYARDVKRLAKDQLKDYYMHIDLDKDDYDQDISQAYLENGELKGVFLAKLLPNGVIEAGFLFVSKINIGIISLNLIKSFRDTVIKNYPMDSVFRIRCQRDASRRLMEYLLPNWIGEIIRRGDYREETL